MIALTIPDKILRGLRRRACRAFPNEYVCFLLGFRREDGSLEVTGLWHPPLDEVLASSDRYEVSVKKHWITQAMEAAAESKCIVLGNIHTHTYRRGETVVDPIQSIGDLEGWTDLDLVAGVLNVVEQKFGRKKSGPLAFYGPTVLVEVNVR